MSLGVQYQDTIPDRLETLSAMCWHANRMGTAPLATVMGQYLSVSMLTKIKDFRSACTVCSTALATLRQAMMPANRYLDRLVVHELQASDKYMTMVKSVDEYHVMSRGDVSAAIRLLECLLERSMGFAYLGLGM